MNRILIYLLLLLFPLLINAQSSLICNIKGGIIDKADHRPFVTIHQKNGLKYIFTYNDRNKERCVKNLSILHDNKNLVLKKNRLYDVTFSRSLSGENSILSIQEVLRLKVKVRQKSDYTAVKAILYCDMKEDKHLFTKFGNTEKFDYYSEYITHIESFFGTAKVLDMYTSPNLSLNPYVSFKLNKPFNPKKIRFEITNNKNLKRIFLKKNRQNESIVNEKNEKIKAVFNAKTQKEAIKNMYGTIKKFKEGNITITTPHLANNAGAVPLQITSDIDAESILVLTGSTWYPAVYLILSTPYNKTSYNIKLNVNYKEVWDNHTITVIIKDKKGNFYKAKNTSAVIHYTSCS